MELLAVLVHHVRRAEDQTTRLVQWSTAAITEDLKTQSSSLSIVIQVAEQSTQRMMRFSSAYSAVQTRSSLPQKGQQSITQGGSKLDDLQGRLVT